jgi:hypothetical protein
MDKMPSDSQPPRPWTKRLKRATGGAFGAGLVLIVLPSVALVCGLKQFAESPSVGLPVLAIFGIMILFGALALISTLFARLGLSSLNDALALPPGSIRAAIALALIVLFALIAVMLYESLEKTYKIENLGEADKLALLKEPANRVTAVIARDCAALEREAQQSQQLDAARARPSGNVHVPLNCTPNELRYTVHLRVAPGVESTDLAKQLLILIGTLMTSVTSFYFASRAAEATTKTALSALANPASSKDGNLPDAATDTPDSVNEADAPGDTHVDGCNVPIESATADADLPPARGGVAP